MVMEVNPQGRGQALMEVRLRPLAPELPERAEKPSFGELQRHKHNSCRTPIGSDPPVGPTRSQSVRLARPF